MTEFVTLPIEEVTRICLAARGATGLSEAQCSSVTRVIIDAQRDECQSHGLYRLLGCVHSVTCGQVNRAAEPALTELSPAILRVDADRGFSTPALERGVERVLGMAAAQGMAALVINNCFHFSALWPEIEPLARRGFAALALTPSNACVAPAGGTRPVFGTNPLAFAWPRPGRDPFVSDFATSASARGEIELHRRAGQPLPNELALDPEGRPTTDPEAALRGAILTFGGHKGSALSAMVELMGGVLIGDLLSLQSRGRWRARGRASPWRAFTRLRSARLRRPGADGKPRPGRGSVRCDHRAGRAVAVRAPLRRPRTVAPRRVADPARALPRHAGAPSGRGAMSACRAIPGGPAAAARAGSASRTGQFAASALNWRKQRRSWRVSSLAM